MMLPSGTTSSRTMPTCGKPHAAIYITPRLGKDFDQTECYDKNIKIINNEIDGFNPRVVWADRAENLIIKGNRINLNNEEKAPFPDAPVFQLENCKNVTIEDNIHTGLKPGLKFWRPDKKSRETLKIKGKQKSKIRIIMKNLITVSALLLGSQATAFAQEQPT